MRVVITGATGNVGTSVLSALAADSRVHEILGVSRRTPESAFAKTRFVSADVARDDLEPLLRGADAVIHLAWRIQPARAAEELERTNVEGSWRVFRAAAAAGVPTLLYSSSVGAYSKADKLRLHDESWPTEGIQTSLYSRQKARVERLLDEFEQAHPGLRVVRFRPALIFKRQAASRIRELFIGPVPPRFVFDAKAVRWMIDHPDFRFQTVHAADVGEAFRAALFSDVRGAFNLAAEPILDSDTLAKTFGAKRVATHPGVLRALASLAYRLRLQPADPGWLDLCFQSPLLDTRRAQRELEWQPKHSAVQALLELLDGLRDGATFATPPLNPESPRRRGGEARQAPRHAT